MHGWNLGAEHTQVPAVSSRVALFFTVSETSLTKEIETNLWHHDLYKGFTVSQAGLPLFSLYRTLHLESQGQVALLPSFPSSPIYPSHQPTNLILTSGAGKAFLPKPSFMEVPWLSQ